MAGLQPHHKGIEVDRSSEGLQLDRSAHGLYYDPLQPTHEKTEGTRAGSAVPCGLSVIVFTIGVAVVTAVIVGAAVGGGIGGACSSFSSSR